MSVQEHGVRGSHVTLVECQGAVFREKIRRRIRRRRTKAVGSRKMSKDTRIMQKQCAFLATGLASKPRFFFSDLQNV